MPQFQLDHGSRTSADWFKSQDEFTQGYVEGMFFCGMPIDDSGSDLRDFSLDDMPDEMRKRVVDDCNDFVVMLQGTDTFAQLETHDTYTWHRAGVDFWFTRNGHSAGFWDRGLGELGDRLTDYAKAHGECVVYLGDDDKLYIG